MPWIFGPVKSPLDLLSYWGLNIKKFGPSSISFPYFYKTPLKIETNCASRKLVEWMLQNNTYAKSLLYNKRFAHICTYFCGRAQYFFSPFILLSTMSIEYGLQIQCTNCHLTSLRDKTRQDKAKPHTRAVR